ncbi:MAG: protein phosphatase [Bacteroidia bacterium]|nr:MAG: protein phosphatase [Bacteroidia bacterium]GIV30434.1 MAG: protein phosphatase [Bacteroidia bacterium]
MKIEYFAFSEKCKRTHNEDSFTVFSLNNDNHCFIVCDGVGGGEFGEVASKTVADSIRQFFTARRIQKFTKENIRESVVFAQQQLTLQAGKLHTTSMASTLALIAFSFNRFIKCWIGDSLIFHWDEKGNFHKNETHSLVNVLIKSGEITPEEAKNHPKKNVITRAVSANASLLPDFETGKFNARHKFLLCSDGFTEAISETDLKNLWNNFSSVQTVGMHLQKLTRQFSNDNSTAIFIEFKPEIIRDFLSIFKLNF